MLQQTQQMRISSSVAELPPQQIEHRGRALRVHVLLLKLPRQFLLVLVPDHVEEIQMPVQRLVLVLPKFLDNRLYAEHQQLVSEMQPELERDLARPVIQDSVDERHDRSLQGQIVLVDPEVLVQVVDNTLETRPFGMVLLKMQHRLEDLPMAARDQADRSEDLQHGDLRLDILSRQRLGYRVDGGRVRENVCPSVL